MREAIREIVADLPHAVLSAAGMLVFLGCVMAVLIVLATPVPA
jgi:hypothetical protein